MYASLSYIQSRHPYGEIPGQPNQAPESAVESAPNSAAPRSAGALANGDAFRPAAQPHEDGQRDGSPAPENREVFNSALHDLARDLMLKEQQIEILINSLPGIRSSEADQERRMRELESELRQVETERAKAEQEKERMVDMLGQVIVGAKRIP